MKDVKLVSEQGTSLPMKQVSQASKEPIFSEEDIRSRSRLVIRASQKLSSIDYSVHGAIYEIAKIP